jgi:hypothetical protein
LKQKRQQLQASTLSSRAVPSELSGIFALDSFCSTPSTTTEVDMTDAREARGGHLKSTWSSSEILNISQKADNLESQLLAALNLLRTNESLLPRVKGVLSHILQQLLAISKTDCNVRIPWLAKILLLLKGTHAVDATTTSQLLGHLSLTLCSSTSSSLAFRWLTQQQSRQEQPLKTDELHLIDTNNLVRALRQKSNPWTLLEGENKGFDDLIGKMAESESPFVEEILELFLSHHKPTGRGKGTREGNSSLVDSLVDLTTKLSLKRKETVGLFLDWLSILDPELLSSKLRRIIFQHSGSVSSSLRSYLLSNLLDKGSWGRQKKCFEYLLLSSSTKQKNVGVALDFISAYLHHPRSWAGFITTETEDLVPSLYQFTTLSSCRIVNYILEESSDSSDALLESRVELMHYAARHSSENLCAILLQIAEVSTLRGSSASKDILLRLYSSFPSVVRSLLQNQSPSSVSLLPSEGQSSSKSQLDTTLHRLLKLLLEESSYNSSNGTTDATTGVPRSFEALKSLASSHSTLVLRYMPLLISALQGRAYLDQTEFLERNHHRLFLFVLGIFDSLRPR